MRPDDELLNSIHGPSPPLCHLYGHTKSIHRIPQIGVGPGQAGAPAAPNLTQEALLPSAEPELL